MALTLDDKYTVTEGSVYLTGIQALVRLPLDQQRRDARQDCIPELLLRVMKGRRWPATI